MNKHLGTALPTLLAVSCLLVDTHIASAQIVPDTSLGSEASIVTPSSNVSDISGGAIRGENLFHSFESFDVGEGLEARFDTPQDVSRIFSRVTGSSASEILGTLGVEGAADLFFLNENGILFGAGSALDLNGSLVLSTAQSVNFADGLFSSDLELISTLSSGLPEGLSSIGTGIIRVENAGRAQFDPSVPPSELVSRPINNGPLLGLSLSPATTLSFVANAIYFEGGIARNRDGRISLIGSEESISIEEDSLGWALTINEQGESVLTGIIELSDGSLLEAVGTSAGAVSLAAEEISIIEGSSVLIADQGGAEYQGAIDVNAGSLVLGEENPTTTSSSDLFSQGINGGSSGDIRVTADNLQLFGGGKIIVTSSDTAVGGNVDVNVREGIVVDGTNFLRPELNSAIQSTTYGERTNGDLRVSSSSLQLLRGGNVVTSTQGSGAGSDVFVDSDYIFISLGELPFVARPSFLGSITVGTGDSGKLFVETETLEIVDGGAAGTANLGFSGNAQDVSVTAEESVVVSGSTPSLNTPSGIERSALRSSSSVTDPAFLIVLEQTGLLLGNAGSVFIETPELVVNEGGIVSVQNDGIGDGGRVVVTAEDIDVLGGAAISASTAGGQGGNVDITSRSLLLADGSSLEATALAEGDGGNLTVESVGIGLVENARISANAEGGRGGSITLSAGAFFDDNSGSITATSALGPQFDGVVTIESPDPSLEESSALPTEEIAYPELALACNTSMTAGTDDSSLIITGTGGTPVSIDSLHRSFDGWNPSGQPSQAKSPIDRNDSQAQGWVANSDGTYRMVSQSENSQITISSASRSCTS